MKIIHFCAGLEGWNGMANTARQFVAEEIAAGHDSRLTNRPEDVAAKIDRVYVHGSWLPAVHRAAKRAKAIGAKLIIRPAGSYDPVRLRFHGWKKLLVGPWERAMLRRADVVLATCRREAEWIRDYLRLGDGAPVVRPRIEITDLKRFFKISGKIASPCRRAEEPSANRRLRVLYLGRQHPLKGVKYLERAVAEVNACVASRVPDCPADGCLELKEVCDRYGEELEKVWEWCDVLCLPTLSENFGRVVAEALEHGRPVITTDGAPAWEPSTSPAEASAEGQSQRWCGHVLYLRGYREGSDEVRVKLLRQALLDFVRCSHFKRSGVSHPLVANLAGALQGKEPFCYNTMQSVV